jgi:hypothetical protein
VRIQANRVLEITLFLYIYRKGEGVVDKKEVVNHIERRLKLLRDTKNRALEEKYPIPTTLARINELELVLFVIEHR